MAIVQPSGVGSSSNPAVVVGNVASGAADSGNPVKIGGVYNLTLPTLTDGQRGNLQLTSSSLLRAESYVQLGTSNLTATSMTGFSDGASGATLLAVGVGYLAGSAYVVARTPNVFKTATATAFGSTAVWTPTSGKKFRLMGYVIYLTADAKLNAAADLEITFQDNTTAIGIGFSSYVPAALTPGDVTLASGVVQLGNGYLAAAANDVLNVNLSAALTGGEVRVSAWGTEE